jgi:hypothetical protein
MRSVILIGLNFVREQRWPLFFLLTWVLAFAAFGFFVDSPAAAEDALMIFKQLTFYGVVFAVFFGSSALHSDLRSHRIFAVLSKAVSRGQYLAGLLAGIAFVLGTFCACTGLAATWVLARYGLKLGQLWWGILALFTACILMGSLALCLSVFLPSLFAAIGSGFLAGLPAVLALRGVGTLKFAVPVYALLQPLLEADFNVSWHANVGTILLAWLESALVAIAASWIFMRRDIITGAE